MTTYATHKTMCLTCGAGYSRPNGVVMRCITTGHTNFKRRPVDPTTGAVIPPKGWDLPRKEHGA